LTIIAVASASFLPKEDEDMFKFMKFVRQHNKEYSSVEEFQERFIIFKENLSKVSNHESYTPFMDVSVEEFNNRLTLSASMIPKARATMERYVLKNVFGDLPTTFDWRDQKAVGDVRDQGQCGSCWAFSAVGNLEGLYAIKHQQLLDLSEQQLVDCDKDQDQGCNGGWMDNAFQYLQSHGIEREADYPYTARDGKCKYNDSKGVFKVASFKDISQNESEIQRVLVENGPLSVAVDASSFQFYSGGINDCSFSYLNHGVTLVGYGEEAGVKFWTIKNSWGKGWGEKGYIRIPRGTGACGVNSAVSTAILN